MAVNYHLPIVFKLNSSSKAPKTVPEKPSGKKPSVYINGRLAGDADILPSIDENTIKSVDVLKPGNKEYPDGAIMITLKDTNPAE